MQVRPSVHVALQHLGNDEGLEDMAGDRPVAKLLRGGPSGQMAHQARVHEEDLGGLGEALVDVGEERLDDPDDDRGLQDGEPGLHRLVVGVDGAADIGGFEQLARARGAGHHEAVELRLVSDVDEVPDVPL